MPGPPQGHPPIRNFNCDKVYPGKWDLTRLGRLPQGYPGIFTPLGCLMSIDKLSLSHPATRMLTTSCRTVCLLKGTSPKCPQK
ncbi:hypothetical protein BO83DRAFT_378415 [Aspergillus eucalypticola CBS 122712]|uniref:Uncharacterized protein n=1 Tax=Aspergillus eucalypticola (strain CBS 122712 / IBT 29274) TaxID=1448314 RepID=A0A317VHE9_ASPEC|nr:uncharacterized protein BO83DRAFT_378415 [Aspergillus eucalypticola CBS 122712]PWY73335.1 hypothetical protein BO83DRAFT_378415 [Aspergillus eucalypticola CBS 122712]